MSQRITGTFTNGDDANDAIDRLESLGYRRDQIDVVMSNETRQRYFAQSEGTGDAGDRGANVAKGAAGGGMIGGTLGAIVAAATLTGAVGATAATGGVAAPFVAGPVAAALTGAGAGAAGGSVIGALFGAGAPTDDHKRIENDVANGGIVISVNARDEDASEVRAILNDSTGSGAVRGMTGTSGMTTRGTIDEFDDNVVTREERI